MILDANYKKADLQAVVRDNCPHLEPSEQQKLLECLQRFEALFDGTLGDWKTSPVTFTLKEGAEPYHGSALPVKRKVKRKIIPEE